MPTKFHRTQYSEYVEQGLKRAGELGPGAQVNIHELARFMGVKVTPSFRRRIKQFVNEGLLWDVAPSKKINPRMSEYIIPVQHAQELPF